MRIKTPIAVATCLICVGALLPVLSSQMNSSDGVAAVTKLENDQVKAALEKLRAARKTKEDALAKSQDELKKVLSVKQEAVAVTRGLLN